MEQYLISERHFQNNLSSKLFVMLASSFHANVYYHSVFRGVLQVELRKFYIGSKTESNKIVICFGLLCSYSFSLNDHKMEKLSFTF